MSDTLSLPQLFEDAEQRMTSIEQNVGANQEPIMETVKTLELATKFASIQGLFSRNENIAEVDTKNIKYLLLPAYLARLQLKLYDDRLRRIEIAEIYIRDFLKRCAEYETPGSKCIPEHILNSGERSPSPHIDLKDPKMRLIQESNKRAAKIAALKEKQEKEQRITELKKRIKSGTISDEDERQYYSDLIEVAILELVDELNFISEEKKILEHRRRLEAGESPLVESQPKRPSVFGKPITIVRNQLQKQVFGAGYPSLPLLTVDEFYHELVQEGALPAPGAASNMQLNYMGPTSEDLEKDVVEKEQKIDSDNPEHLMNARAYDDWKDDHPRGFGNRMGKG